MVLVTCILHVLHPGRFLPNAHNYKIYLATDCVTEIEGPGWDDKRNWCITCLDPFDLVGLARGHDKQSRFWETDQIATENAPGVKEDTEDPFKSANRSMQYPT